MARHFRSVCRKLYSKSTPQLVDMFFAMQGRYSTKITNKLACIIWWDYLSYTEIPVPEIKAYVNAYNCDNDPEGYDSKELLKALVEFGMSKSIARIRYLQPESK